MASISLHERMNLPSGWDGVNVGVALSGGADSMALLRGISCLKQKMGGDGLLAAFHVNHRLRGEESDADATWCQEQCDELEIPITVAAVDTASYAKQTGQGIEAAARDQRYRLLAEACDRQGIRYLATAHTRNDQVETILFRILRGTGLRGLSGIPRIRSLSKSITLIRPLLACSRTAVETYLAELGQEFRTDRTNENQRFTRNRIRNALLPQLKADFNKDLDDALLRLAVQANEVEAVIERLATDALSEAKLSLAETQASLQLGTFSDCESAIVREALRIAWRKAGLAEQAMTYEWWCQLAKLLQGMGDTQTLNLPGDVRASIDGDRFLLQWQ